MTFTPDTLDCITQSSSGRIRQWRYTNTDAHTDIDAAGYFAGMAAPARNSKGMALYDLLFYIDTDTGTTTMHHVSAISAAGDVTVSVATLV